MSQSHNGKEKVVYVGDSRVKKGSMDNIPHDYTAFPGKSEAFIPNFLLKEWMVGAVVLVGILVLTMGHPAPLGYPADPLTSGFIPMPDWYFLFLYQLLKYPYVSGDYILFGVLGVPAVAFGALLLAPFLDTGKERRFYRRPIASALMLVSLLAVIYLTKVSWDHYEHQMALTNTKPEHIVREEKAREALEAGKPRPNPLKKETIAIIDEDDPAMAIIQAQCIGCHATDLMGNPASGFPALAGVGDHLNKDELVDIITNGKDGMPAFEGSLSTEEIDQLAVWLAKQKSE
ncbi:menaquinol-cytochrome C reductase [Paenibacillaceae bacterium]|nr:menaquinol-cytochrome C reductase [Paenibacillaceae bacterium]